MLRYQSRRHRYLMDESEQALSDAADADDAPEGNRQRDTRIARQILGDARIHRLWESRHADLVLPVAKQSRRDAQIYGLRDIGVKLLHRRALINCIRKSGITGKRRDKLFSVFYGPRDTSDAILMEHRQYLLAVSSRVSTDHLIDVMHDPVSAKLLREYKAIYSRYFRLFCIVVGCDDKVTADAIRVELAILRRRAMQVLKRLQTERPERGHSSFEREALLARSGRYPILDYMVK